jgi:hypothetical protein
VVIPTSQTFADLSRSPSVRAAARGRGAGAPTLDASITFVASLHRNRIRASCTPNGAMNGESFQAYVKLCLGPTLKGHDIV